MHRIIPKDVNHHNARIVVAPYLYLVIKASYSHMVTHFLEYWSLGMKSHTAYRCRDRIHKFLKWVTGSVVIWGALASTSQVLGNAFYLLGSQDHITFVEFEYIVS